MITLRLTAADVNHALDGALAKAPDFVKRVEFVGGQFTIEVRKAGQGATLHIHPDLARGQIRLAIPLDELRGHGVGMLLGPLLRGLTDWIEQTIENLIADQLEQHQLPWDLVWLDNYQRPGGGKVLTVHVSPYTLNQFLLNKAAAAGAPLAPRLSGLSIEVDALEVRLRLVDVPPELRPAQADEPMSEPLGESAVAFGDALAAPDVAATPDGEAVTTPPPTAPTPAVEPPNDLPDEAPPVP